MPVVQNGQPVEYAAPERPHKYNAQKMTIDGVTFDSRKEARRYLILKARASMGQISGLELQPRYELQPSFKRDGKAIRAIHYVADFRYTENGRVIVEDAKGMQTPVFKIKFKMLLFKYPDVDFRIV